MGSLVSEQNKVDIGLHPATHSGVVTGPYLNMRQWRSALFAVSVGAMAAGATCAMQVMQARNALGLGEKVVTGLGATITANDRVTQASLTLATVAVGNQVTINGLTYTAAAAADLPNRVFSQAGTDTDDAASLAAAINHPTAGVPGIRAVAAANVVTLTSLEPGERSVTVTLPAATITVATVAAVGYCEVIVDMLDNAGGFTHVAMRLTNSAGLVCGCVALRGLGRYEPAPQAVAAARIPV